MDAHPAGDQGAQVAARLVKRGAIEGIRIVHVKLNRTIGLDPIRLWVQQIFSDATGGQPGLFTTAMCY